MVGYDFMFWVKRVKRKKRIQTREEKIFVFVNDCLTGDPSAHDLSLNQDMNSICTNGCRISKCMKKCFIYRKSYKGTLSSTLLAKSLHQRLWDGSPYLLKQLPGIGMVTASLQRTAIKLVKPEVMSLERGKSSTDLDVVSGLDYEENELTLGLGHPGSRSEPERKRGFAETVDLTPVPHGEDQTAELTAVANSSKLPAGC